MPKNTRYLTTLWTKPQGTGEKPVLFSTLFAFSLAIMSYMGYNVVKKGVRAMRIRKFKDYNQYYSRTYAYIYSYGRYNPHIYMKRIKPKTNAIMLKGDSGKEIVLASGLKGINKYLKLHPDDEIEI